jgi:hypothetical protein
LVEEMDGMIAARVTNNPPFKAFFNPMNLNFLILSNSPCLGQFSVGELNVI